MSSIKGLEDWILDKRFPDEKRNVQVSIHPKYIDIKSIYNLSPKERKAKVAEDRKQKIEKIMKLNLFTSYEVTGSPGKPSGLKAIIPFLVLSKLNKIQSIAYFTINKIDKAKRKVLKASTNFYCVKMTVVIEVEKQKKGIQTIEDRMVLIKAKSFDDAYKKMEKVKDKKVEPYLNIHGELVRWRIESLDDCFVTDINTPEELNNPGGVEVYSKLKGRRLTKDRVWNGEV
ncbi:MAG: DUF4288 domain-containing protein [Sporocytophaga sp.]|uniref:DUF4288 domain-containing protein n=1 Tax=Sporocytophaga sp. TaxID=2231183 RepID=UPI001B2DF2DC|nr:DUF4288 domain-containing protein [Sporocytophaga sp.]MBO9702099.1 DUF4288 domain-containing protein [Sporocytophaga sp.]